MTLSNRNFESIATSLQEVSFANGIMEVFSILAPVTYK